MLTDSSIQDAVGTVRNHENDSRPGSASIVRIWQRQDDAEVPTTVAIDDVMPIAVVRDDGDGGAFCLDCQLSRQAEREFRQSAFCRRPLRLQTLRE